MQGEESLGCQAFYFGHSDAMIWIVSRWPYVSLLLYYDSSASMVQLHHFIPHRLSTNLECGIQLFYKFSEYSTYVDTLATYI